MPLINPSLQDMIAALPPGERDEMLALLARAAAARPPAPADEPEDG